MKQLCFFLITMKTEICTRVFSRIKVFFKWLLRPTDLIDANLKYYGSSLKGASDGASMILGGKNMTPIIVNEKRGIYWFPVNRLQKRIACG